MAKPFIYYSFYPPFHWVQSWVKWALNRFRVSIGTFRAGLAGFRDVWNVRGALLSFYLQNGNIEPWKSDACGKADQNLTRPVKSSGQQSIDRPILGLNMTTFNR